MSIERFRPVPVEPAGRTKIDQLRVTLLVYQNVQLLQIPMQDPVLPEEVDCLEDLPAHPKQSSWMMEVIAFGEIVPIVLQVYAVVEGRMGATAGKIVLCDVGSVLVADEPQ